MVKSKRAKTVLPGKVSPQPLLRLSLSANPYIFTEIKAGSILTWNQPLLRLNLPIPYPPPLLPRPCIGVQSLISKVVETRPDQKEDEADGDGKESEADMVLRDGVC